MADRIPLRLLTVSGIPTIGEFQAGDTLGVIHGGTGTSSLVQLKYDLGLNSLALSGDLEDIDPLLRAQLISPSVGDSLVWNGSYWTTSGLQLESPLSSLTDVNITSVVNGETLVYFSSTGEWKNAVPISGGSAVDHGLLTGLGDDDHPQYVLSATNLSLSSLVSSIEASTVALSSYIETNSGDHGLLTGLLDNDHPQYVLSSVFLASAIELSAQMELNEADILDIWEYLYLNSPYWGGDLSGVDHGILSGLLDNDHPQYVLSATNQALSSLVTSVEGSTVDISAYIAANETAWSTDNDTTDHTQLTNIGTNTHAQIDGHISDITKHFTVASIDHGSIAGLGDNDHPQYVLSATNQALSSLVTNVEGSTVSLSSYIAANEGAWQTGGVVDHSALSGLDANDHPQYVLSATNQALSSLVTSVEGSTVSLSAYIAANEAMWSADADVSTLSGLGDVSFTDLSTHQHIVYDGASWVNAYNDTTEMRVRNGTASPMSKGDVIAIENAHNQDLVNVVLADASQTSAMPALGILEQDLAVGEEGIAITFGKAQGLNTSGLTEGATAYVSPFTPGTITETKPTDTSHLIQNIGIIMRAHPSNGAIKVTGIGRANDIDNVTRDNISTLSSLTASIETSTVDISAYIAANETQWATDVNPADHSALNFLDANDHPQYVLSSTNSALSAQVDSNTSSIDSALDLSDVSIEFESLVSSIHHGSVSGLTDNDHPQYVLSSTNLSLSAQVDANTSAIDNALDLSDIVTYIEHGDLNGLGDNDHPQYVLSSTNQALSSLVTSVEGSTVSLSSYIAANEGTWSTDTDTTDHTALTNIGTNTHAQIDSHIADSTIHFTEASIDHGSIAGLGDNDHPQYVLSATNSALSAQVDANTSAIEDAYQLSDIEAFIDHGNIAGLSDNDHPQYVLSSTNQALSSLVTSIETSTVDISSYIAANEGSWSTGGATDLSTLGDTAISSPTNGQSLNWNGTAWVNSTPATGVTDHGLLTGLSDNDHPQYVLSATNQALSSLVTSVEGSTVSLSSYIAANESTWSTDTDTTDHTALTNIGTNTHAQIDSHIADSTIHFTEASIDHGSIAGLTDNDHPQYVLSATNQALSSLVTSVEGSTVDISSYIAANESTWATDTDTTDHTALTNIGTNTHAQIDSHIADSTIHFTEASIDHTNISNVGTNTHAQIDSHISDITKHFTVASIDHGSIAGLSDNDHPQYVLSATNQALSSLVTSVEGSTVSLSSYIAANESTWSTDTDTTDHTALTNIGTNTHAQIDSHIADSTIHFTEASIDHTNITNVGTNTHAQIDTHISNTNTSISNLTTSTVNLSGYIAANETTWATDTDTTDHTALTNIGTNTHAQIDTHIADSTIHFTEASIDHTNITNVGTNTHAQIDTHISDTNTSIGNLTTSTVNLSGYIAANETTWATDTDTTDHTALTNIGTNTHAQIDSHIADSTIHFTEGSIDHTNITNVGTNTHAQIDAHITGVTAASGNWESTYNTVLNSSGSWGGGGGVTDHGALTGLADDDHPQYVLSSTNLALSTLVQDTADVSSIFSGNITVTGTTASHVGTIGTTAAATFGIESSGNTSIIAPSIILSATTAYQFRKNGSTTYTDTDFPQSCRDWDSVYNTVNTTSGTWGGGGGGGVAAGITVVNTGTDNIDSAGALVPLDVTAGYPAYGSYATDYSYTAGNSYVTINTAGTYEVTFNVAYTSTVVRWNGILKIYKGTGGASPSSWIGYGAGKGGYVRAASGHNDASLSVTCLVTCSANDTIGGWVEREAASGTCTTVANETFMTIKRMA